MKLLNLLSVMSLMLAISSCESDVEEPSTPGPGANEVKLMEIDKDAFNYSGSSYPVMSALVTVDSNQRTITTWFDNDNSKDGYQRRYFDEKWRLTKIVTDNPQLSPAKDSVLIKRAGAGIFDIERSGGVIFRYTVSSAPDGGMTISALELNGDPQLYNRRIIDKNGLLIYSAISRQAEPGYPKREFHHFIYNGNHQLISVKDTAYYMPEVRAFEHTITKNGSDNSSFISFMKKMVGTDLSDWVLYDPESPIPPFRFVHEFTNFGFLQNGAFMSNRFKISEAMDGVNFKPYSGGDGIFDYEYEYDSKGRMISMREMEKSKLVTQFKFRYYD